jgi:hypothetical protein
MSKCLPAVVVLRAAVTERRPGACEAKVASAAACIADAWTAYSSMDDRYGGECHEEYGAHADGSGIKSYSLNGIRCETKGVTSRRNEGLPDSVRRRKQ